MNVVVNITLTREEVEEFREGWKEYHPGDISDEEIKDYYLD